MLGRVAVILVILQVAKPSAQQSTCYPKEQRTECGKQCRLGINRINAAHAQTGKLRCCSATTRTYCAEYSCCNLVLQDTRAYSNKNVRAGDVAGLPET